MYLSDRDLYTGLLSGDIRAHIIVPFPTVPNEFVSYAIKLDELIKGLQLTEKRTAVEITYPEESTEINTLTAYDNLVLTNNDLDGFILPPATQHRRITVRNSGESAYNMVIYPKNGEEIRNINVETSDFFIQIAPNSSVTFVCFDDVYWEF
jgi:hypothetical protein